ncbi:YlbF family regulator [Desulfosporosinus youngiae]|uniref:UPF0342 protein DesyoDRAFT_4613 n=1 Tax=Desulfosporosinus youngiae DSM 17734 TaxID=768710 RepID=H5XYL1_9FIRM|nr:YlbF family regulator [Desulfosporosinus youngiae]EHQ91567.1 hypothetical protein DesyoDRAFT_4613 [Desulfosporosinus youngiae DSM 17734]
MSTTDLAHELARTLKESDQFKNFLKSKEKVMSDANNHKVVREFQLKQWEIREAQMLEQEISEEKQQELERLYSLVSINPTAREYLEAEFKVSCMVHDIQKIIGEAMQDAMPIGFEEVDS